MKRNRCEFSWGLLVDIRGDECSPTILKGVPINTLQNLVCRYYVWGADSWLPGCWLSGLLGLLLFLVVHPMIPRYLTLPYHKA